MPALVSPFELDNNYSVSHDEMLGFYQKLVDKYPQYLSMSEAGPSDAGLAIHEIILDVNPSKKDKLNLLINNAIHPGEPCGVDATMMFVRDILENPALQDKLQNTRLLIIPAYNIGGMLNRGAHSRANQLGPKLYGFRGNAKNLDLNRDFIKSDSKNARTFASIFHRWNPEVFIDNHTSNGADYTYTMTLIATQKDKLAKPLSRHLTDKMLPYLYKQMEQKEWEMIPYVYAKETPDGGIIGFLDLPRYSSGYASLFHTLSFMPETHMLKPYKDRVYSTYAFMESMVEYLAINGEVLKEDRATSIRNIGQQNTLALAWELDKDDKENLMFKGYEAKYKSSDIHGQNRLYYDRNAAYNKAIPFMNSYKEKLSVSIPKAYLIPQAYDNVVALMKLNGVEIQTLENDQVFDAEQYYIEDFETVELPYEGHYLHRNVSINPVVKKITGRKGDFLVQTDQNQLQYIMHVLEPQADDSFFAWNYFDGILMQKEYFSSYVFEDLAAEILANDPVLKQAFEQKKSDDKTFAEDARAQLKYIYEHSDHKEPSHNLYPVAKLSKI